MEGLLVVGWVGVCQGGRGRPGLEREREREREREGPNISELQEKSS